jgi:hypothetical protein
MILWVLILACSRVNPTSCVVGETAMYFQTHEACQRLADGFNNDTANKESGAEERCVRAFQGPERSAAEMQEKAAKAALAKELQEIKRAAQEVADKSDADLACVRNDTC